MTKTGSAFCGSAAHSMNRRGFLGAVAVGASTFASDMGVVEALAAPSLAAEVKRQGKHVLLLWLAGGASQLETWDPKPGRPTGGPFRAIETAVPGVRICELMPKMAQRMNTTALVRSLNTKIADHGSGALLMETGKPGEAGVEHPDLGAMVACELARVNSAVPDYVSMYTSTEGRRRGTSGFLGSPFAPMFLSDASLKPADIRRLDSISDLDHRSRADLQQLLSKRFLRNRQLQNVKSHASAYGRVRGIMASESLFDISREHPRTRDKYGPTQFAEQVLAARRLMEAGVPFVKVARAWWDSHGQNFETHLELATELDHVMATLIDDLEERSMLQDTLIITLGEFGRTPTINASLGRDHFARAWSASLTGCGIKGGAVYGATDDDGQYVKQGEVGASQLFATIFQAIGIDPQKEHHVGDRPIPLTDPGTKPIAEILA